MAEWNAVSTGNAAGRHAIKPHLLLCQPALLACTITCVRKAVCDIGRLQALGTSRSDFPVAALLTKAHPDVPGEATWYTTLAEAVACTKPPLTAQQWQALQKCRTEGHTGTQTLAGMSSSMEPNVGRRELRRWTI